LPPDLRSGAALLRPFSAQSRLSSFSTPPTTSLTTYCKIRTHAAALVSDRSAKKNRRIRLLGDCTSTLLSPLGCRLAGSRNELLLRGYVPRTRP
jgi:hypothetical protein